MNFYIIGQELFNWYQWAKIEANIHNIKTFEIDYLLEALTDLSSLEIKLNSYQNKKLINSKKSLAELTNLWNLRIEKRCPLQYLIGETHWRNFVLKVTPDVLIPRPETELIIDLALEITANFPSFRSGNWLDLGTGSGAIAIGLFEVFPEAEIHAIDKSKNALKIAQENANRYNFQERITFYHGSWFQPINHLKNNVKGIVSNPPYIPSSMVLDLQPEVINHEPKIALDGGEDGLNDIRELINNASNFLIKDGFLLLEIMASQGIIIKDILEKNSNYKNVNIHYDLAGLDRFISAQKT